MGALNNYLVFINVATFLLFGLDKLQAKTAGRRVPELVLICCGAIGGWPGGTIGIFLFRHKSVKVRFLLKHAAALLLCCLLFFVAPRQTG